MAEEGGVKAEEKGKGVAVWEVGERVRVSILHATLLFCLNYILNCVMYDRLKSVLELVCYCNAMLFKLGQFRTAKCIDG